MDMSDDDFDPRDPENYPKNVRIKRTKTKHFPGLENTKPILHPTSNITNISIKTHEGELILEKEEFTKINNFYHLLFGTYIEINKYKETQKVPFELFNINNFLDEQNYKKLLKQIIEKIVKREIELPPVSTYVLVNNVYISNENIDLKCDTRINRIIIKPENLQYLQKCFSNLEPGQKIIMKCSISGDHIFIIVYDYDNNQYIFMDTREPMEYTIWIFTKFFREIFGEYTKKRKTCFSVISAFFGGRKEEIKCVYEKSSVELQAKDSYYDTGFCQFWTLFFIDWILKGKSTRELYKEIDANSDVNFSDFIFIWYNLYFNIALTRSGTQFQYKPKTKLNNK